MNRHIPIRQLIALSLSLLMTRPAPCQSAPPAAWPKVQLHLHLDCSLSYAVVKKIDPSISPEDYQRDFIAPARCTDLRDYITRAIRSISLMQTKQSLRWVTLDLFRQLQKDHVLYAEIRFAPLQHLQKGLTPEEVVTAVNDAVAEGIRNTGIQVGVILCTLRHYSAEQSMTTVQLVEKFRHTHIVGFDIAADEAGYPIDNHIAAFAYARERKIPCTAHAGEAKGPASVRETLDNFHPSRIGHGVRSIEDTALVSYLVAHHIHLEICPSSNLQTNIYNSLGDHPIHRLYKAGVSLSINTDAYTISNTTLNREYQLVMAQFHWSKQQLLTCNLEAIDHAFTDDKTKKEIRERLLQGYKD
ncbi:adenosine deaminase [Flavitalea sp. BT771]|uniref:adenosine deaminase n=1 Tax=Flavitalea sp. BT771 TaxID=3063329 RepID=UPI0026E2C0DC|nr:adenosine deaminase [Flavitalea sp. BT771]MDO6432246.1 adenosine deaminase [Flavitalea sp. BT771]MDV6221156.1 adenosine deaminase [Flavitalea sp. BT771]